MGIGPTQSAWKADVLPLNYTRTYHGTKNKNLITNTEAGEQIQKPESAGAGILSAHLQSLVSENDAGC